jgi:PLP dependent protein
MSSIADRLNAVRQTLPPSVKLVAVTKQVAVAQIRQAYAAGVRDFAESRVQEAIAKQVELQDLPDITWHLIGHLQRNKAAKALEHFTWIHSVDSLDLVLRLNQLAAELPQKPNILLQVKLLDDPNKYGWSELELRSALPQLSECNQLNIRGLMTILPFGLAEAEAIAAFEQTRALAAAICQEDWKNLALTELSMGMSDDYLLAVKAGATMIRPGSILFGQRQYGL